MAPFESLLPSVLLIKNGALNDGSDSQHDSEAKFVHGGRKRHETLTPTNIRLSLRDTFLIYIESCSTEPAKLGEVVLFYFLSLVLYGRQYLGYLVFNPLPLFPSFFRLLSST